MQEILGMFDIMSEILVPILGNKDLIGAFALIYGIIRIVRWIERKSTLSEYEEVVRLEAEKRQLREKYSGKIPKDELDPLMDMIRKRLETEGAKAFDFLLKEEEV